MGVDPAVRDNGIQSIAPVSWTILGYLKGIYNKTNNTNVGGGVAYADKTITSLTGSSQTMMASNASRKSLLIKNGDTAAGINLLGGTAAIGGAGTITLQPYEGLFLKGADCPVGAITVIGTSTKYISGYEGA